MSDQDQPLAPLILPSFLRPRVETSAIPLVRDIDKILADLVRLRGMLDRSFQWRETSVEVFTSRARQARTAFELNKLFWSDMASVIKAYCLSASWRSLELIESALSLLDGEAVLGPTILSRSLIELTTTFITNGGQIRYLVTGASQKWSDAVIFSLDLENLLNKAIFGSRLVPEGHELRQTNIITQLKKLSKLTGYEPLMEYYERLCEVAHPNMMGNARFWYDVVQLNPDGSMTRFARGRAITNERVERLYDDVLWTLSWSGSNLLYGFGVLDAQVRTITSAFSAA